MNPPCIRDIYRFRKTGCPEKAWNGKEGCQAWCEIPYDSADKEKGTIIVKACVDMITLDINIKMLALLEGNQQATESLRNGLCTKVGNETVPKAPKPLEQFLVVLTNAHNKNLIGN